MEERPAWLHATNDEPDSVTGIKSDYEEDGMKPMRWAEYERAKQVLFAKLEAGIISFDEYRRQVAAAMAKMVRA